MTEQEVLKLAVESGLAEVTDSAESLPADYIEALAKFAWLSAMLEREACAQIVERNAAACDSNAMLHEVMMSNAAAIRARNKKDNKP